MANQTRLLDFVTGVETSTAPTAGVPSNPEDLITKEFADQNYQQGTAKRESIADVKAIPADERKDGDKVWVQQIQAEYFFDSASVAAGDDDFVLVPDSGSGRWLLDSVRNKQLNLTDTTNSTDKDTGAIVTEGGVGIEKDLSVGGILRVDTSATINNLTTTGTTTFANSTEVEIFDANITVNVGGTEGTANLNRAGLTVETDTTNAEIGYNSALESKFACGNVGDTSEIATMAKNQNFTGLKKFEREIELEAITTPVGNPTTGLKLYAKSDDNLYVKNSAGAEIQVGTGAGGGANVVGLIQFLAEDFETSISSAIAYDDGGVTDPIDGTGAGGAGLTATLETGSSRIAGNGSFRIDKDGNNRRGQGRRFDFSLDGNGAYWNTLLPMRFLWKTSVNYDDGDVGVYIYDVDNSQLLNNGQAYVDLPRSLAATPIDFSWVSTNSNNYRLLFHTKTTEVATYSWLVDNLVSETESIKQGTAFNGIWKTYPGSDVTVTSAQSGWSYTSADSWFKPEKDKNGDWYLEFNILGTYTAATISSTGVTVTIPGVTFYGLQPVAGFLANTTNQVHRSAFAAGGSGDVVVRPDSSGTTSNFYANGRAKLTGKPTWADFDPPMGQIYQLNNDVVKSNARMKANSSSAANIVSGVGIIFENEDYDTDSSYDETTGIFTAPADGEYRVSFAVTPTSVGTNGYIANINVDTVNVLRKNIDFTSAASQTIEMSGTIRVNKGQEISVNVSSADLPTAKNGDGARNYISIERISNLTSKDAFGFSLATSKNYGLVQGDAGPYTPTILNVANIGGAITVNRHQYSYLNGICTVSGSFSTVGVTDNSFHEARISLPIPTTFTNTYDCNGTCTVRRATTYNNPGAIEAYTVNNQEAILRVFSNSGSGASHIYFYTFQYEVK